MTRKNQSVTYMCWLFIIFSPISYIWNKFFHTNISIWYNNRFV